MEECILAGFFPRHVPRDVARQILREFAYENLDTFHCMPSVEQVRHYLTTQFKEDVLEVEHCVSVLLSPEEAMNTVSALSLDVYQPVGKKRKLSDSESNMFTKCRGVSKTGETCSICLCAMRGATCQLACGCLFHRHCIKKAYAFQPRCPLCYTPITISLEQ